MAPKTLVELGGRPEGVRHNQRCALGTAADMETETVMDAAAVCVTEPNGCLAWRDSLGRLHRDGDLPAAVMPDGSQQDWYCRGKRHRDGDLPAVVLAAGSQYWYTHGKKHRDGDLPAVVDADGHQEWWQHGKLHRRHDLPAHVEANGSRWWYKYGVQHRNHDLPAVVDTADGSQWWFKYGQQHRDGDLPAVVWPDGRQQWWVHGVRQSDCDRERTRRVMAQAARWSPLRAAFVGAVAHKA